MSRAANYFVNKTAKFPFALNQNVASLKQYLYLKTKQGHTTSNRQPHASRTSICDTLFP
jgi:hypothetical protein